MFFIGLLFGLGFETASEVALLAMSATSAANGVPGHSRHIYNAVVTGLSVVVAFFVGTIEWIQLAGRYVFASATVVAFANRI
jgi:high-affinity nickel-transport protein